MVAERAPFTVIAIPGGRGLYPLPFLTAPELFLSPDLKEEVAEGPLQTRRTPVGDYDLAALLGDLKPDLVVVMADPSERAVPRNLAAVSGRKVLIIGDTHHMARPIQRALDYAASEPFDLIVGTCDRHHLHFFAQAGLAPVHWLPFLSSRPVATNDEGELVLPLAFVGSIDPKLHPWRRRLIDHVKESQVPIQVGRDTPGEAAPTYARARVCLNISLNGDLDNRMAEILGAGGLLLTDRLSPEAGLENLFAEGRHLVLFDGADDLVAKARALLADPEAQAIRQAGRDHFWAQYAPAHLACHLHALVFEGRVDPRFALADEPRHRHAIPDGPADLLTRVEAYEAAQEFQRRAEGTDLLFAPGLDPALASDGADLVRLKLRMAVADETQRNRATDLLTKTRTADRGALVAPERLLEGAGRRAMLVAEPAILENPPPQGLPDHLVFPVLLFSPPAPAFEADLARQGYVRQGRIAWARPPKQAAAATVRASFGLAPSPNATSPTARPRIALDAVFFQDYLTGIARVWEELLAVWKADGFIDHLLILDRDGYGPEIAGLHRRNLPRHDYQRLEEDRQMLQELCDAEGIDLFISTFCTTPRTTPSVFMAYDMIPEEIGIDAKQEPMWKEKHDAIHYPHTRAYLSISEHTAKDLARHYPHVASEQVTVAPCGVNPIFTPAGAEEIQHFRDRLGIDRPYFLLVGQRKSYKNAMLFFRAFQKLPNRDQFAIVNTGAKPLEEDFLPLVADTPFFYGRMSDAEMRLAYAGATALVFPSFYEGFGMPVIEAMACGCPVITTPMASLPEVAGPAALYVDPRDVHGMAVALHDIQQPEVRRGLIAAGFQRAKLFRWTDMAATVKRVLLEAAAVR
ncbi:MAG: glycosyltransferase [Rhodospirillales bacterium]|nr:glycosyltransferase [Rhodospirillales bacterium]